MTNNVTAVAAQRRIRSSSLTWPVFILLLVSVWLNYIDRGNLSVAAPLLAPELSLGPKQMGLLLSAFFWTYALSQFVMGWLVDKYPVSLVYGIGYLVWSVVTMLTGFVEGFASLFALRLLLGLGESVAYPAYSKMLAAGFEEGRRGFANALVDASTKAGPAVGVLLGGLLVKEYGWRMFFIATGGLSLIWLIPWMMMAPRTTKESMAARTVPIAEILSKRSAWGTFGGLFCVNYAWYFLITWLPTYLVKERHFSMQEMALLGSVPFWGIAATSITGGLLSDAWIRRGGSPTRVRKTFLVAGVMMSMLMLPAALVEDRTLSMTLLILGCLSFGFCTANIWAVTQTLAGPTAVGKWTGLQNGLANFGGVVSPAITGWLVAETGSFVSAFIGVAIAQLACAIFYGIVIERVEPVTWKLPEERAEAALP